MEADTLSPVGLGLLLLPFLVTLLAALCVRCRELPVYPDPASLALSPPASYDSVSTERLYPSSIFIKPTQINRPSTTDTSRSPQPFGGCQQDSNDVNSVASYENQEPTSENEDDDEEDEEDYPNEGYLEVLPDSTPATIPVVSSAPVPSNPGLRDSAFSMESGEDYVNVLESEDSAEASLDGSREYVNVSQELQPVSGAEQATVTSQEVVDEGEEEGVEGEEAPDYENLQELH
ncbi:linker for activation of T-cells family member 1 isoform X5 [Alexandromys fortis]|uniref:linker for activation of T-cells family member 1 isoform X5 n=1 Tax=Alexandromys fortis TaxID=100897 RepID=UPI002152A890|nr:linker for activation of T-cells family member 1 isoform X5 [Microtus fortis]